MNTTITLQQSPTQTLILKSGLSEVEEFSTILEKHEKEEDLLSEKIFKWGTLFLEHMVKTKFVPSKESIIKYHNKFMEILKDPFEEGLLEDPVILEAHQGAFTETFMEPIICSKAFFERYKELRSVLFQKETEAKPHLFAQKILVLLSPQTSSTSPQRLNSSPKVSQQFKELQSFEKKIKRISMEKQQKQEIKLLTLFNDSLLVKIKEEEQQLEKMTHRFEEFKKKETKFFKNGIKKLVHDHAKSTQIQEKRIDDLTQHVTGVEKVVKELHTKITNQQSLISQLRQEVNHERLRVNNMAQNNDDCIIL